MESRIIDPQGVGDLIAALEDRGYEVVGPRIREGAIVYDVVHGIKDLPQGWTDRQEAGRYRLERRADDALFGYAVGPHSWKRFLFLPSELLWRARVSEDGFHVEEPPAPPRRAFLGVRACEVAAIGVQDRIFFEGSPADSAYAERRRGVFLVAVQCGTSGGTCFCASMGTGPKVGDGYDLRLTEILGPDSHYLVAEAGTAAGEEVLRAVPGRAVTESATRAAEDVVERTSQQMGRSLDTTGIKDLLYESMEHPRWDDVARRCLTCANCTMVCPTCFCSTVEDVSDLSGDHAERWRRWDSCFTMDFSYISGGAVRPTARSRYRQWMTHKLATWQDQFGTSGCVGCGRCITWCPVGIDITEEARALRTPPAGERP